MGKRTPILNSVPVAVHGGLNNKVDAKQVRPPNTLQCDNFTTQTLGALTPRPGTAQVGTVGSQDVVDLGASLDELLAADSGGLYALLQTQQTFTRRGDYTNASLSTKTILNQAVNQNYTWRQVGGVRNLTVDYIGNVGIAVWDTGITTGVNTVAGGVVYICAFDANTGKPFWVTTTTGYQTTATSTYQLQGYLTPSALTVGAVMGASSPCVVAYQGKWIVTMMTYGSGASSTASGTTINGYLYQLNAFVLTPDGTTGIPPQPTITDTTLTNVADMFSATQKRPYVMNVAGAQNTGNDAFYTLNELVNFYYDITQNGTDLTIVASMVSMSATSTTPYPVNLWRLTTNQTVTNNVWLSGVTTTLPPGNGGSVAKYAPPIAIASYPGCNVVSIATISGALMTTSATYGAQSFGSVVTYTTAETNNIMRSWPVAVGIVGTTASYALNVSNGYYINSWAGTNLALSSKTVSFVNVPMMNTRQLIGDTYYSIVASRMFYIPSATVPASSGVYDPAVWLYATSITQKFTNLVLVRLNTANYTEGQPINLSEIVARGLYLKSFPLRQGTMRPPAVIQYSGAYVVPQLSMTNVADSVATFRLVSVTYGNTNRQIIALPQGALLTGADTRYYDGINVRSAGWQRFPDGANPVSTTTGGTLPIFTYTVYFVYVEYAAYGNAIYSSPSQPYQVTTGATQNALTYDISQLWPAASKNNTMPVAIQAYRNSSLNPLQFYRTAVATYIQTTQVPPLTLTDTGPDDISGNPLLYSPPGAGEVPNDPPPPSTCAVATKQRVYVASAEDPSYLV